MDSSKVHPDLQQQHQRYKILAAGLVISSLLPAVTFFIFYSSKTGLVYMSKHLLTVMVAFILEVPLMFSLAYFLAVKRMRFLERSTDLVKAGNRQELELAGAYKVNNQDGSKGCHLVIATQDGVEQLPVIPSKSIETYVSALPDLPELPAMESKPAHVERVYGFIDPETKRPVAVELGGNVMWISPPAKMF